VDVATITEDGIELWLDKVKENFENKVGKVEENLENNDEKVGENFKNKVEKEESLKNETEKIEEDIFLKLKKNINYPTIHQALIPKDYNFIVTPKEIDELIEIMTEILARSINNAI
jgi:hypothetical protein